MSKKSRTTINRLRRTVKMIRAKRAGESWWTNPNNHPLPTLPDQVYLRGEYLVELARSSPHLVKEVLVLLKYIGENEEGRVKMEGGRKGKEL